MKKGENKIKYAIQLGLAVFPVVLLLIVSYMILTAYSIVQISRDTLEARTNHCATQMNDWTGKIISELSIYKQIIEEYTTDTEQLQDFLHSTYQEHDAYPMGIYLGDDTGLYLDASGWVPGEDWVLTERPWYIQGKDSSEFSFCEPYLDAQLGVVCTSVSARLNYDGAVRVMSVDVYVDYADELIKEIMNTGGLDGALFVANDGHTILADSAKQLGAHSLTESGDRFYSELDKLLTSGKVGISKVRLDGQTCYVSIVHLEATDWYLIGYVRESTFLTSLKKASHSMGIIGVLAILLLVLLVRRISINYRESMLEQMGLNRMLETRAQENLDMVNDIIGSGLWYMDFNTQGEMTHVFWSQTFRHMLGFEDVNDFPDCLESWSDRLYPEDKEATLAAYWDCVKGKKEYNVKYRLMKRNGEYEWFHAHGRIARYANGKPRLFLGTFINITKDLQTRQALEEAYQAANRANAAKTEFLSSMSHDIRTPLNGIIGMTAIAGANIDNPEKVQHCLSGITVSSKHLLSLVNEVLDMNKIESGKISLNVEEFNLADLVDSVLAISKPLVTAKRQDLDVNIHEIEHENVVGDYDRLQQCIMNFISNAVKYTPEGGKIWFSLSEKSVNNPGVGCYEFVFEDNGIGMSEDFIPMLFEPFERADDERAIKQQGTGLGMSITRNIIQMMNGDIKVESKLNEGSKFTVTVFLALQDGDESHNNEMFVNLPVLVVDDDQIACESTCYILNDLGMLGEWVLTGKEAVDKIVQRHNDQKDYFAVILDWKMPDMDGIATTKAIRKAVGKDIPIIIISAYDWSDIEAEARAAGVNGFIAKPVFKSRVTYLFRELTEKKVSTERKSESNDVSRYKEENFDGKRILLVEDNELNAEIASEILSMTGVTVDIAWNGREAVDILEKTAEGYYDIVFMDIQMPVMNGYEATRAIRASERADLKEIPIIAMSANAFAEDVLRAKSEGMNDHLAKPLDFNRLLAVLNKWLRVS